MASLDSLPFLVLYMFATPKRYQLLMTRRRGYLIPPEEIDFVADPSGDDLPIPPKNEQEVAAITNKPWKEQLHKTCLTILTHYYNKLDKESKDLPLGERLNAIRQAMSQTYYHATEPGRTLYVMFAATTNSDVGTAEIEAFAKVRVLQKGEKNTVSPTEAILITKNVLTTQAAKAFPENERYQHFMDIEFMYDPTSHYHVPKHVALTKEEQDAFFVEKQGQVKPSEMQRLKFATPSKSIQAKGRALVSDPQVKYFGWVPGQVIKIYRKEPSEQQVTSYISYRFVS